MAVELDNDPRIPTLTDVVKQGNPSLMFNLKPPPSASHEHQVEEEDVTEELAEAQEQIDHNEVIELDVYEKEVQDEMFQVTGHPDDSDLVIREADVEESAVIAQVEEQAEPEPEQPTPETPKSSFSLEALGLPFDFFSKASHSESEDSEVAEQSAPPEHEETQPVSTPPEVPPQESAETLPDLDVESVLMALEAPISEILQRHMDSARDEIHGLIREQLERHHQD